MMTTKTLPLSLALALFAPVCAAQTGDSPGSGVASNQPVNPPGAGATAPKVAPLHTPEERAFHVGAGDVLNISVWEEPQLTTKAVVRPDGYISMPLVDQVLVDGLTPEQIQKALTEQLTHILKHPRVFVVVEEIHSRVVYITGEVGHPGAYPLVENINVMQLIARSGGLTEYARKHQIVVLRQTTGQKMKVDYDRLLKGRDVAENVALIPGDMVVVP